MTVSGHYLLRLDSPSLRKAYEYRGRRALASTALTRPAKRYRITSTIATRILAGMSKMKNPKGIQETNPPGLDHPAGFSK